MQKFKWSPAFYIRHVRPNIPLIPSLDDFTYVLRLEGENVRRHIVTAVGNVELDGNGYCIFPGAQNDYLNVPHEDSLNIEASTPFCIQTTINMPASTTTDLNSIISHGGTGGITDVPGFWLAELASGDDREVSFIVRDGSSQVLVLNSDPVDIVADTDTHIAVSRNADNTVNLYIDGVRVATSSFSGAITSTEDLHVGADHDPGNRSFQGLQKNVDFKNGSDNGYSGATITPDTEITVDEYTVLALDFEGTLIDASDDFSGTDGNSAVVGDLKWDTKWTPTGTFSISGDVLSMADSGASSYLVSNAVPAREDVIYEIDFDNLVNVVGKVMLLRIGNVGKANIALIQKANDGPTGQRLRVWESVTGGYAMKYDVANSSTSGTMKIVSSSSDIKLYYDGALIYTIPSSLTVAVCEIAASADVTADINYVTLTDGLGDPFQLVQSPTRILDSAKPAYWRSDWTANNDTLKEINSSMVAAYNMSAGGLLDDNMDRNPLIDSGSVAESVSGKSGGCAEFDGTTKQLRLATSSDFNIGSENYIISFWANPADITPSGNQAFMTTNDGASASNRPWGIYLQPDGRVVVTLNNDLFFEKTNVAIMSAGWNHIALTFRDLGVATNRQVKLWVNGVAELDETFGSVLQDATYYNIGQFYANGSPGVYNYNGLIDEVYIAKSVPFADASDVESKVLALYNSGAGSFTQGGDLPAATPIVPDISGNENDATQATVNLQPLFDPTSNEISLVSSQRLEYAGDILLTSSPWVFYMTTTPSLPTWGRFFRTLTTGGSTDIEVGFTESGGRVVDIKLGGSLFRTSAVLTNGVKQLITITHDPVTPETKIYIDGVLKDTNNTITARYDGTDYQLGDDSNPSTNVTNGICAITSSPTAITDREAIEQLLIEKYGI